MSPGPPAASSCGRRLAYFGETIAHSALLGVALAILIDFNLTIGIFVTASMVVLVMFYLESRDTLPTDTLLGLLAHGGLALGLVILSFFPNMRVDLQALLFGDILAVSRADLAVIWIGGVLALGVLWLIWRPLLAATVSADLAKVAGMNPDRARLVFGIFSGGCHRRRHQGCRGTADRGPAGYPGGDGAPLCIEPRTHGNRRGNGWQHRRGGRFVRLCKSRHAVGPLHRGGRAGVVRGHATALYPLDCKRSLTGALSGAQNWRAELAREIGAATR